MKKIFSLIAALLVGALAVNAQTTITFTAGTDKGADGGTAGNNVTLTKDGVTITVSYGMLGRSDNYRCYADNTMTISSTVGSIQQIDITCTASGTSKYGPGCFTAASGTYTYNGTTGTWTGSAESVTLTASAQVRMTQIVVTVGASDSTYVADPVFSPAAGTYYEAQQVSITSGTTGAVVYYTTDGTDPTSASTAYSGPITVSASTTIKAIAINGDYKSNIVSAEYVITEATKVATLKEANALADDTYFAFTGDAVVTYQYGKYLYLQDASGAGLIYASLGDTLDVGQVLSAGWKATKTTYSGLTEYTSPTGVAASGATQTVTPAVVTEDQVTSDLQNALVQLKGVAITLPTSTSSSALKATSTTSFTIGTALTGYNKFKIDIPDAPDSKTYNITGIVTVYNSAVQFYPTVIEEVQTTGVNDVNAAKSVAAVSYYNLAGQQAAEPFEGVNVVKTVFTDGTSSVAKVVK